MALKDTGIIMLDKKLYPDLVLLVMLGSYVRGAVADQRGESWQKYEDIERYILSFAKDFGFPKFAENFKGQLIPSDMLSAQEEDIIEAYDDDEFWHQLYTRLGQRDYERSKTDQDRAYERQHHGMFPDRIMELYEKYENEFEKNGIENLEIKNGMRNKAIKIF